MVCTYAPEAATVQASPLQPDLVTLHERASGDTVLDGPVPPVRSIGNHVSPHIAIL